MALKPALEIMMKLRTELNEVRAARLELQAMIRRHEVVDLRKLDELTIARAHRIRDQILTAPARHAATLAAEFEREPAELNAELTAKLRRFLQQLHSRAAKS